MKQLDLQTYGSSDSEQTSCRKTMCLPTLHLLHQIYMKDIKRSTKHDSLTMLTSKMHKSPYAFVKPFGNALDECL